MPARLSVEITASEARFREDLHRAVGHAERASRQIEGAFRGIKFGAMSAGIALAVSAVVAGIREITAEAAKLDDLADSTGSTVENLSKLNNQAKISGASFETLSGLVLKLSAGMAGADDESTNVGRALKALGVNAKDPAEALQQIAVALDKYKDGVGKAAIARDLFGKGGPAFLAVLKDIAQMQDVAATVTTKQAEEAEQLEKAFRRLSHEAKTFANEAILSGLVPALTSAIEQMREGTRIAGGFLQAIANFGTINPFNTVAENLAETQQRIADITAGSGSAEARWAKALGISDKVLEGLRKREEFLKFQQRQDYLQSSGRSLRDLPDKPELNYGRESKESGGGRAKAARERISDAQRYLDALEQQLQRTQELTTVERVLADVESGRLKLSADVPLQALLNIAQHIDQNNELKRSMEALAKQEQEEARIREQTSKARTREQEQAANEVARLAEQNEAFREEITLIGATAEKSVELEKARLGRAISLREETAAMLENAGGSETEVALIRQQIALLKERQQLVDQRTTAEEFAARMQQAKAFNDLFVQSFANGMTEIVMGTRSVSEAFRDMERQIVGSLTRMAAQNLGDALFGAKSSSGSGGGIFAALGPWLADLFNGTGSSGYLTAAGAFAAGGSPPVGQLALVGERGPELFVPRTAGTIVPNDVLMARRAQRNNTVNVNINVPGNTSRASADQIAAATGAAVQRALARIT